MMAGRGGRGGGGGAAVGTPAGRVTTAPGLNRFVWNVTNREGLSMPPARYQARLKVGTLTQTQPFNVLIDPNLASDGVTAADLKEQYDYTIKHRKLVADGSALTSRVQAAMRRFVNATGAAADTATRLLPIATKLFDQVVVGGTPGVDGNMRYGKPGLQRHITYMSSMITSGDMKLGRDAIKRHETLRKELDAMRAAVDRILGPAPTPPAGPAPPPGDSRP
jgi:hypothetical protein